MEPEIILKSVPVELSLINEDEEVEEDESFSASQLLNAEEQDEVSRTLVDSGTIPGLAAAAALVSSRKRHRPYKFEVRAAQRKRQNNSLIRKLKQTIHELCTTCGQQAVVLCVSPGKENPSFRVFGSSPLDQVVKNCQSVIFRDLERELQEKLPSAADELEKFELPPLMIDGIPTTVEQMNQAQLRMFIPEMLKYSTGRGKPGWGKEAKKPPWWPQDVPWANVRRDARTQEAKLNVSWTQALRRIVKNCYRFHEREDLLFSPLPEPEVKTMANSSAIQRLRNSAVLAPGPTLVQTIHNADGTFSLVQVDSGETIATISRDQSGAAVAVMAASISSAGGENSQMEISMEEPMPNSSWSLTNQNSIGETYTDVITASVSGGTIEQKQQSGLALSFATNDELITSTPLPTEGTGTLPMLPAVVDTSAMVHIPVSVYEKIANTIQQSGIHSTLSLPPGGRIVQLPTSTIGAQEQQSSDITIPKDRISKKDSDASKQVSSPAPAD